MIEDERRELVEIEKLIKLDVPWTAIGKKLGLKTPASIRYRYASLRRKLLMEEYEKGI